MAGSRASATVAGVVTCTGAIEIRHAHWMRWFAGALLIALLASCSDDSGSDGSSGEFSPIEDTSTTEDAQTADANDGPFGEGEPDSDTSAPDDTEGESPEDVGEDAADPEDTTDSDTDVECREPAPAGPCETCQCLDGSWFCAPLEVGDTCISDDCCQQLTTCQPCTGDDCPGSGLVCEGAPVKPCEAPDACSAPLLACLDGVCECQLVAEPNDTACVADPDACTTGDTCMDGACVQGPPAELDDDNPCTTGVCVKGAVEQKALTGPCSDGDPCTLGDSCVLGQCVPDSLQECPLSACSQLGFCDSDVGACVYENSPNGSACDDGAPCSAAECVDGACVSVGGDTCDDADPCTTDTCLPGGECQSTPIPDCGPGEDDLASGDNVFDIPEEIVTKTVPPGTFQITVSMWGGGGGGGKPGAGGGGAWVRANVPVTPGTSVEIGVAGGGVLQGTGAGASYVRVDGTVMVMAGGGGGGGADGCGGCSGGGSLGAGGAGGPAGGIGQAGTDTLYLNTNSLGGGGGTQVGGGAGGIQANASGFSGCEKDGEPGGAFVGGFNTSSQCFVASTQAMWNIGGKTESGNGGSGGGGAGWYGGGAGANKWTYSGAGGGGGSSYTHPTASSVSTEGGNLLSPGGMGQSGYNGSAGQGGDGSSDSFMDPDSGNGGLIIVTL